MDITDFSKGAAWSILPETFDQLMNRYTNMKVDMSEVEPTALNRNAEGSDGEPYIIEDRVAIIPIMGPIFKRPSFFSFIFGGASSIEIGEMVSRAAVDSKVSGILLKIDSPGGVVNGTESLSDIIFDARAEKPIVAYADGNMTSAAYWLGSAAEVVVAGPTSVLGSIGVLMIHRDYSEMDKRDGIKTTYITAGKYKAFGNGAEPLTLEAKEYFQDQLNYVYSIFVDSVARNRDVETEKVLINMAEGKLFIGQQSMDAGLVDQIGTIKDAKRLVLAMVDDNNYSFNVKKDGVNMEIKTVEKLVEAYPSLVLEVQEGARKPAEEEGKAAIKTERDRVVELVKIQFGAEQGSSFGKLIHSDITPDLFKATKDLVGVEDGKDDDKDSKQTILDELKSTGAENPGADGNPGNQEKDYMVLCNEYKLEHKCSLLDAMRAVDRLKPDLRVEYIKAVNK